MKKTSLKIIIGIILVLAFLFFLTWASSKAMVSESVNLITGTIR